MGVEDRMFESYLPDVRFVLKAFMISQKHFFYLLTCPAIALAVLIFITSNPIYSVISFILSLCFCAGALFLIGRTYWALIFLIIYAGAVAILFVYVIMTITFRIGRYALPFNLTLFQYYFLHPYTKIGYFFVVAFNFFRDAFLFIFVENEQITWYSSHHNYVAKDQIVIFAKQMYQNYGFFFIEIGFMLLFAMVGSVLICQSVTSTFKKQNAGEQLERKPENAVVLKLKKR